jgi:hypothetical protein
VVLSVAEGGPITWPPTSCCCLHEEQREKGFQTPPTPRGVTCTSGAARTSPCYIRGIPQHCAFTEPIECRPAASNSDVRKEATGLGEGPLPGEGSHRPSACRVPTAIGVGTPHRVATPRRISPSRSSPKTRTARTPTFLAPSVFSGTPHACHRVCVVHGYRTLCTLRSSVRSTVPWRHHVSPAEQCRQAAATSRDGGRSAQQPMVNQVVRWKRRPGDDSGVRGVCRVLRVLFETSECSRGSLPPAAPM